MCSVCVFCVAPQKRFPFICRAFTRITGAALHTFSPTTLTHWQQPYPLFLSLPPLYPVCLLILGTSLCSNFTLCRKLYSLLKIWWANLLCPCMTPCMPKLVWPSSCLQHNTVKERWGGGLGSGRSTHPLTSFTPLLYGFCKETWNPPHTSHKSCSGWGV